MMQYFHLLVLHFSAWLSLLLLLHVHEKGLPESFEECFLTMLSAVFIALVGSVISAHGHSHFLQYAKGLI